MAATALIDANGQPDADSFYTSFNMEPVLPSGTITIASRHLLYGINVTELLEQLVKVVKAGQEVLLVCHGTKAGPSIPFEKDSDVKLQQNALKVLFGYEEGKVKADDAATRLMLRSTIALYELVKQVKAVRDLKLNRLELRACEIGGDKETLKLLKRFFGCSSICAPKNFDVFGTIDANTPGPLAIGKLLKLYPRATITGTKPNRFGLWVSPLLKFHAAADSQAAITSWAAAHMPQPGSQVKTTSFPVHGITSPGAGIAWAGEQRYRTLLERI